MIVYAYAPKPGAEKEIYERIGDITVSMKADEQLRMPPCVYRQYPVSMSPTEYAQYEKLKRDMVVSLCCRAAGRRLGRTRDETRDAP